MICAASGATKLQDNLHKALKVPILFERAGYEGIPPGCILRIHHYIFGILGDFILAALSWYTSYPPWPSLKDACFDNLKYIFLPTSCSEISPLIFLFVMSLCEARNSTTFPFSFLIGTISNKHQNGDPEIKWTI